MILIFYNITHIGDCFSTDNRICSKCCYSENHSNDMHNYRGNDFNIIKGDTVKGQITSFPAVMNENDGCLYFGISGIYFTGIVIQGK